MVKQKRTLPILFAVAVTLTLLHSTSGCGASIQLELIAADESKVFLGKPSPRQHDFRLNFIAPDFLEKLRKENKLLVYIYVDMSIVRGGVKPGVYSYILGTKSLAEVVRSLVAELDYSLDEEYPTFRVVQWNHAMLIWPNQLMSAPTNQHHLPNLVIHNGQSQNEEVHPGDIVIIE